MEKHLVIDGIIGYGENTLANIKAKLEGVPVDAQITVSINSYGGSVFEGLAIYQFLKTFVNLETQVLAFAMSAGTLILLAGKKRSVSSESILMLHGVQITIFDSMDAEALQTIVDKAKAVNRLLSQIYQERTSLQQSQIQQIFGSEMWLIGVESLSSGLATQVQEPQHKHFFSNSGLKQPFQGNLRMDQQKTSLTTADAETPQVAGTHVDLEFEMTRAAEATYDKIQLFLAADMDLSKHKEFLCNRGTTQQDAKAYLWDQMVEKNKMLQAKLAAEAPKPAAEVQTTQSLDPMIQMRQYAAQHNCSIAEAAMACRQKALRGE